MEKILKQTEKKNKNFFAELSNQQTKILENPLIGPLLKGDLKELRSHDFHFQNHSLRICYAYYEEDNHVTFIYAGTRENFYAEVKRYVK